LSGEKSIVKNLFDDSPTLLALTTQLTDPTITPSWSYNSVEASRFGKADVGFLGDMNNISLFGNGQRVGEATRFFGSPALINIGDPLLKRLNENIVIKNTDVDAGKGQQLFADNGKGVMQSIPIDFNNDKIQDLLVVHSDSTIRLLK